MQIITIKIAGVVRKKPKKRQLMRWKGQLSKYFWMINLAKSIVVLTVEGCLEEATIGLEPTD